MTLEEATHYLSLINLMLGFLNLLMFAKAAYLMLTEPVLYVSKWKMSVVMFLNLTVGLWMIRTNIEGLT